MDNVELLSLLTDKNNYNLRHSLPLEITLPSKEILPGSITVNISIPIVAMKYGNREAVLGWWEGVSGTIKERLEDYNGSIDGLIDISEEGIT